MLISIGDILDLYYRFIARGRQLPLLRHFLMNRRARTTSWWDSATGGTGDNWWDVPAVIERWNRIVSGDPSVPPMQYVGMRYFAGIDNVNLLSIGCGTGVKEIAIARMWPSWNITGIDGSENRITIAREHAARKNIHNVTFMTGDAGQPATFKKNTWQIILFDSSLHHFSGFDILLGAVADALAENSLLVINEYVGPDRFQWTREQLREANRVLQTIPPELRRYGADGPLKQRIYRPGYLRMVLSDPSEAASSSGILPAVHRHFSTLEEKPLGGNLLHLVLKGIASHFTGSAPAAQQILERLFEDEDRFIDNHASDFVFGVYRQS